MAYTTRIIEGEIRRKLSATGAVAIEGPKACGKTRTGELICASAVRFDVDATARESARGNPAAVLSGDTPRLLDEWQLVPDIWNHVRREIDDRNQKGLFVLAGSTRQLANVIDHSGAGRISSARMRTMTLCELGLSNSSVSLAHLMASSAPNGVESTLTVRDLAEQIVIGGWPGNIGLAPADALQANKGYLDRITNVDIGKDLGHKRSRQKVNRLFKAYARNLATYATLTTIAKDIQNEQSSDAGEFTIKESTVRNYLDDLESLFIIEEQLPWENNFRSSKRLRRQPKHHFVDPSLAVAALNLAPDAVASDLKFMGFLFESLVIRDLRVYSQHNDASVYQYKDESGLEVDAIIEDSDGRYAAVEIKLGSHRVDEGAKSLNRFKELAGQKKQKPPVASLIVTGSGYPYRREDGIFIVPVGCLAP